MRMRPFIPAGEQPRPFSEIRAERDPFDPTSRILDDIAALEGEASEASDPIERKRLQCEAEALRCVIHEKPRRKP